VTATVTPTRAPAGTTTTANNGSAAPVANDSADVHAAWNGRASSRDQTGAPRGHDGGARCV
jgi:hypothetical protein